MQLGTVRPSSFYYQVPESDHQVREVYSWSSKGTFSQRIAEPTRQAALAALIATDILALFSTSFFRRKFYQFFIASHVIALISLLVAVSMFLCISASWTDDSRLLRYASTRKTLSHTLLYRS